MSNTVPICGVCGDGGHGIQFPLFPKTEGAEFGTICVGCDNDSLYSAASFDTPEEEIILCLSSTSPETKPTKEGESK